MLPLVRPKWSAVLQVLSKAFRSVTITRPIPTMPALRGRGTLTNTSMRKAMTMPGTITLAMITITRHTVKWHTTMVIRRMAMPGTITPVTTTKSVLVGLFAAATLVLTACGNSPTPPAAIPTATGSSLPATSTPVVIYLTVVVTATPTLPVATGEATPKGVTATPTPPCT